MKAQTYKLIGKIVSNQQRITADKKGNQRFQSPSATSFIRKTLSEMPKPFHKKIAIGGDEYGI